ncbi:MAG: copper resistance CopC/CopD family protein [Gemmatimonas sp.]
MTVALMATISASAQAHAVLLGSIPADGATLTSAPDQVTLTFNEPVTPIMLRLIGEDGGPRDLPFSTIDSGIVGQLPEGLPDGGYIVSYRIISLDSHPVGGSFVFTVGAGARVPPTRANAPDWEFWFPMARTITLVAVSLVLGGALLRLFVLPVNATRTAAAAQRIASAAAAVGAITALAAIGLRGAGLLDSEPAELLAAAPWRIAFRSTVGPGFVAIAVALVSGAVWSQRSSAVAISFASALVGLALTSHAALATPTIVSLPAFLIHAAAATAWFGSLPLLIVAVAREPLPVAHQIVARFSRLAVWGVGLLLAAGIAVAVVQTGPTPSIWLGPVWRMGFYGWILTAKLALVAVVVAIAVRNKLWLTPVFASGAPGAAQRLRSSIALEAVVMAGAVALAAALGSSVPPRSLAALQAAHHPAATDGGVVDAVQDGVEILLEADPATPGPNDLVVHFFDEAKGVHLAPQEVSVSATLKAAAVEPIRRPAVRRADGTYRVEKMPLTVPGTWEIRVEGLLSDFDKVSATLMLPIGAEQ